MNKLTPYDLPQILAATDGFSAARLIGKGSHGTVYKALLPDGTLVAVKKQSSPLLNSKLQNEIHILSSLLLPPNSRSLVNLLGVGVGHSGDAILVAEYLPNGTLHDLLHSSPTPPTWHNRLKFALQIAQALRFLHAPESSVAHRDIKPANVLLDADWNAKLGDFGLAVRLEDADVDSNPLPAGTLGYIDPNYTTPSKLTTKVDVYSYGVVLLELISGRKAIDVTKSPASVVEWAVPLIQQRRSVEVCDSRVWLPPYMEGSIELLLLTAVRCLSLVEDVRPSMSEIVGVLERLTTAPAPVGVMSVGMNYVREIVGNWMTMRRRKMVCDDTWVYFVNKYTCGFHTSL